MRLLLLLSALFTALTGVATGASASPQMVEASASVQQARVGSVASIAPLLVRMARARPRAIVGAIGREVVGTDQGRDTFGERRRE